MNQLPKVNRKRLAHIKIIRNDNSIWSQSKLLGGTIHILILVRNASLTSLLFSSMYEKYYQLEMKYEITVKCDNKSFNDKLRLLIFTPCKHE